MLTCFDIFFTTTKLIIYFPSLSNCWHSLINHEREKVIIIFEGKNSKLFGLKPAEKSHFLTSSSFLFFTNISDPTSQQQHFVIKKDYFRYQKLVI